MYGQVSAAGSSEHSPPHLLLRSLSNLRRACAAVRPRREVAQKAHGHRPRSGSELFASEMLRRRRSDQVSFRIRALGNEGGGESFSVIVAARKNLLFSRGGGSSRGQAGQGQAGPRRGRPLQASPAKRG